MAPTIGRAVDSVISQSYADWEMIIVDNGGDKAFDASLEAYSGEARIKVFSGTFEDRSKARNHGILHSSGDFITFLDADDALAPDYLSAFEEIFSRDSNCIAISDIMKIEGGRQSHWNKASLFDGNRLRYAANEGNITFAAKRECFVELPFRYDYWEDKLWLGLMGEKHNFSFTGKPYYEYHITSKIYSESDFLDAMDVEIEAIKTLYSETGPVYSKTYHKEAALNDFYIKKAYVALSLSYFELAKDIIYNKVRFIGNLKTWLRVLKLRWMFLNKRT